METLDTLGSTCTDYLRCFMLTVGFSFNLSSNSDWGFGPKMVSRRSNGINRIVFEYYFGEKRARLGCDSFVQWALYIVLLRSQRFGLILP